MRLLGRLLGCIIGLGPGAAAAQVAGVDFTGTYRLEGPEGTLTITLRQAGGTVTGKMSDDSGTTMLVEGDVDDGEFSGFATFGQQKIPVLGKLQEQDRLVWTMGIEESGEQEYVLQRVRATGREPGLAPPVQNPLGSRQPNPLAATSPWVGEFSKADGSISLVLHQQGEGFGGSLTIRDQGGAVTESPVALRVEGSDLAGSFGVAPGTFPMSLRFEPESGGRQVVVTSGDYVHVLDRKGVENPPAYRHPEGWYTLSLPDGWRALAESPMAIVLDAGKPGAFISVLASHLDPGEAGQAVPGLFQEGLREIDALLVEEFAIRADSTGARARALGSSQHPAAEASWAGTIQSGSEMQPVRIWAGVAVDGDFVVLILAVLNPEHAAALTPQIQGVLGSARILKAPSAEDLERLASAAQQPSADPLADPGGAHEFNRRVTFNGARLDDATIQVLERGMGIQIPDHDYWYDPGCGAVGGIGGPAVGFFPAGLRLGGPLRANASGGGNGWVTGVFINGRELHMQDLVGLSSITGPVAAGRYWLDGQGNFGVEGGGVAGNLLVIARARQAQGGAGGGGGGGGGSEAWTRYKDYGGVDGGTNFGSFGGGDFYFSGGGVDWWPGK